MVQEALAAVSETAVSTVDVVVAAVAVVDVVVDVVGCC